MVEREYFASDASSLIGKYPIEAFGKDIDELCAGRIVAVADSNAEIAGEKKEQPMQTVGSRARLGVPLMKAGQLVAVIWLNHPSSHEWNNTEIELAAETAERTWDAVERARSQESLKESQKRMQLIANLVPDLLWDSEPDGSTNWYNQRWLEYTGQRFEEAIGWGWVNAIHPDDRQGSAKRYREAVEAGIP